MINHISIGARNIAAAKRFYDAALKPLGVALPVANAKVEGALTVETPVGSSGASLTLGPDGFFDGGLFDPDTFDDYIERQKR